MSRAVWSRRGGTAVACAVALALGVPVAAQDTAGTAVQCAPGDDGGSRTPGAQPRQEYRDYDVIVDVPDLCVERIALKVQGLDAHLSLNSVVANLVRVQAGADVSIRSVDLGIHGVRAEALLLVDLDNVVYVVNRTLTFLDRNPELVPRLMETVSGAVGTLGGVAGQALGPNGAVTSLVDAVGKTLDQVTTPGGILTRTVDQAGRTVVRALGTGGSILEHTLDSADTVVNSAAVGSLADLELVRETTDAAGRTVRRVQDTSGAVLEYTLGTAGEITNPRVVQAASERRDR